nr:ribonuclease H-like domain-containing protein [Tanacetum cinerariifolium]
MAVEDDINSSDNSNPKTVVGSSSDLNLSFGNPLYLHPNDTSGTPVVTIKLTGTKNYKMWSIVMTFALRNHNKIGFIDRSCKKDSSNPSLANQWDMCNSVVVTWIINSLNPELFAGAIYAKTASEIWNDLKETYDKVDGSVVCFELIGYRAGYVKRKFNSNSRHVTSNNASADVHSNSASSNNATTGNSPVSLSSEQLARLMNLLNENGVSSANADMTGLTVGHPNGTQALITKTGDLKINNEVTLYDVLVVSEYTVSLLYVHKLLRDSKLFVGFDESNSYIQDLKANKNVGIGKQYNGIYLFDVDNSCKLVSNNCIASCSVSKTLWHQRLGHHADQVFDVLKTTLNLDSHSKSDHLCDTCNKAKQTREPFPLSNHKTTKIELSPDVNQDNDDSCATSMDETNNTHPEGTVSDETNFLNDFYVNSEFNSETKDLPVYTLRRSSRQTKLPSSLNDFIEEGKVKYGVERVVNYANLNHDNYCFSSALNKSVEPTCYE